MHREPAILIGTIVSIIVAGYQAWAGAELNQALQDALPVLIGAVLIRFGVVSPATASMNTAKMRAVERKHGDRRVAEAISKQKGN